MTKQNKQDIKTFPLRLKEDFSIEIDTCVYQLKTISKISISKHQYILDAVREKMDRDKEVITNKVAQ